MNRKFLYRQLWKHLKLMWIFEQVQPQLANINEIIHPPDSFDWRDENVLTPIKNQKSCGSCWAFAAIAVLEFHHFIKTSKLLELSMQQLLDCSNDNFGCDGGDYEETFNYLMNTEIASEVDYPYKGRKGHCRQDDVKKTNVKIYGYATVAPNEEALKRAVHQFGPIAVQINTSPESFQYYSKGVYDDTRCTGSESDLDHAVVVVGYGHDTHSKLDYWIIRNSWSEKWGEDGYMRLARNRNNLCGVAMKAAFPLLADNGRNEFVYFPKLSFQALLIFIIVVFICSGFCGGCCCCLCCCCFGKRFKVDCYFNRRNQNSDLSNKFEPFSVRPITV